MENTSPLIDFFDHWQTLVGSFTGALLAFLSAVSLWKLTERSKEKRLRKTSRMGLPRDEFTFV